MQDDGVSIDRQASDKVEQGLIMQQIDEMLRFKVLLLGAGESGKSAIVKQLEMIHKKKKTSKELKMIALSLHQNVIDCLRAIINASRMFCYWQPDEYESETADLVAQHDESEFISPALCARILRLFSSEMIEKAWQRRSEFWCLDSLPYCLQNLERFCDTDFLPNDEDIIMARIRTTGIVITDLEHKISGSNGNSVGPGAASSVSASNMEDGVLDEHDEPLFLRFQVVDVGGQRNERKKWIHCFDDVKCVLFIVNLAGYNQVLFEDNAKNRMIEELELFERITNDPIFSNTPIFLFLNKKDLFETMVSEVDMSRTFADYAGGKNLQSALEFIKGKFLSLAPPKHNIHILVVTARWRADVKAAFEEVKRTLYAANRDELVKKIKELKVRQEKVSKNLDKTQNPSKGGCCF